MFIGHYAAAFAAKAVAPRAPLWSLMGAAQLLDLAFSGFLVAGVEKFRVDPGLAGNPLDLYQIPWSHGLIPAILWSLAAAGAARLMVPWRTAAIIGAVVFSHWLLDWVVHRPDLELWFGGPKVGLGFWNTPVAAMAFEVGIFGLAGAAWVARRKEGEQAAWPAILYMGFIVLLGVIFALPAPEPESAAYAGIFGIALFLFVVALALPMDRSWRPRNG